MLHWLLFNGVVMFAAVALWRYGLIRLVVVADRTHIALLIGALYALASLHNLGCAFALAGEAEAAEALGAGLPPPAGLFGDHVRALAMMARPGVRLDPTLLLRLLAERLSAGLAFGALMGDILMKLGLLGTIVGFILMLGPIGGLDAQDDAAVRAAMGVMSQGMGVAMYTTLAGLIGALLLRAQYGMLESATVTAFWDFVRFTQTRHV